MNFTNARLQQLFQALLGIERVAIPIFVHNPNSQQIAGVVIVAEEVVASLFGMAPQPPPTPSALAPK